MDRLDTWLNAQRGRRRLALLWLQLYLPSILVVNIYPSWRNLFGDQISGIEYVWLFALSVPCAAVLAGLTLLMRAPRERRSGRSQPLLSWRLTSSFLFLATEMTLQTIFVANTLGGRQQHRWVAMIMFACAICFIVLSLENLRYVRRMRRLACGPAIDPPFTTPPVTT